MKKKCLLLIPGIPFPPVDGHKLKIYNLIRILHKTYDLHIVTISREVPNAGEAGFIADHSYKRAHFKIGILGTLLRMISNFWSQLPFQVAYFTLPEVEKYLKVNASADELVILNLIRTAHYLPVMENKKVVFDMVDLLSKSYFKSSHSTSSSLFKILYNIEGKRLAEYEKSIVSRSALTLCVNQEDAMLLKPFGKVNWLPNGVNPKLFGYKEYNEKYKNGIVFFGTMFYQPNIDAVLWFAKNVINHLNKDIVLYIIGARPSKQIIALGKKYKNLVVTGFLDDPYVVIKSCFAVIAPMQNGGGIQNKILETMGMGKINVLSSYGAKPIVGAHDKEHFFIEDDPVSMAGRINDIFLNDSKYRYVGKAARDLILNNYTWEAHEEKLVKGLSEI